MASGSPGTRWRSRWPQPITTVSARPGTGSRCTLLASGVRETDIVGRYGGEEIVLMQPQTSIEAATATAERLRCAIEGHDGTAMQANLAVTVSIGPCFVDVPCAPRQAIRLASAAPYAAKAAGRDRVVVEPMAC